MGLIDRIWGVLTADQYNNADQRLVIEITDDSYNQLKKEYSQLSIESWEKEIQESNIDLKELSFFFGADVRLTAEYLDVGFKIDEEI